MENNGESFLRQLSVGSSPSNLHPSSARGSRRWRSSSSSTTKKKSGSNQMDGDASSSHNEMRLNLKKRVMVVIDESSRAKHAMMWALTHIANKGDHLTLLHVVPPPSHHHREDFGPKLANSLGSLCKSCKPEVEVEALVIQGPKLATVLSQVKKLEASVLVLSQGKTSPLSWSSSEDFVEQCINKAECLALAVRKQSKGVGGYLVSSKWQKNFWLLA